MRQIKFRAWDKENKKLIYNFFIFSKGNAEEYSYCNDTYHCGAQDCGIQREKRIDAKYVMQYTNLKDKNGKEIYEGDIVSHVNGVSEVRYEEDSLSFQMDLSPFVLDQGSSYEDVEVIGNIYENKNLIK